MCSVYQPSERVQRRTVYLFFIVCVTNIRNLTSDVFQHFVSCGDVILQYMLLNRERFPNALTEHSTDPSLLPPSSSQSSSRPSSTSTANKNGGGGNGANGLSVPGQIAIGVVLPSLSLIAAVIFGVRMWRRR